MDQDRARLARAVLKARGSKSQEFIAAAGGPSTTTQSKIELEAPVTISRKTREALEYVYGWAPGSVDALLGGGEASEIEADPGPPFVRRPDEPDDAEYMTARTRTDSTAHKYIEVVSVRQHQGESTRIEVRFWPGSNERSVIMPDMVSVAGDAHRSALRATMNPDELEERRLRRQEERELSEADDTIDMASLETDTAIDQAPGESQEDAP